MVDNPVVAIDVRPEYIAIAIVQPHPERNRVLRVGAVQRSTQLVEEIIAAERAFNKDVPTKRGIIPRAKYGVMALNANQFSTSHLEVPNGLSDADQGSAAVTHGKRAPKPGGQQRIVRHWAVGKNHLGIGIADAKAEERLRNFMHEELDLVPIAVLDPATVWLRTYKLNAILDDACEAPFLACTTAQKTIEIQEQPTNLSPENSAAALTMELSRLAQNGGEVQRIAYFGDPNGRRYQAMQAAVRQRDAQLYHFMLDDQPSPPWAFALALAAQGVAYS